MHLLPCRQRRFERKRKYSTYFSRIAIELKKINGRTALVHKKIFQQKYHVFEWVTRLYNTDFPSHLHDYRIRTDRHFKL